MNDFFQAAHVTIKVKKDDVWFRFVTVAAAVGFLVSDDFLPLTNLRWWIHKPADHIFYLQRRPVEPAALQVNKRQGQIHWASHMYTEGHGALVYRWHTRFLQTNMQLKVVQNRRFWSFGFQPQHLCANSLIIDSFSAKLRSTSIKYQISF